MRARNGARRRQPAFASSALLDRMAKFSRADTGEDDMAALVNRVTFVNYLVKEVQYRVVREASAPDPRLASSPADVAALVADLGALPDDGREHFGVLMLNTRNAVVAWHRVSTGTLSSTLVHPRDVFGLALRALGVASLVLVHNHPSGDPTPSCEDIRLTRQLAECARVFDIKLHDHIIVGNGSAGTAAYASFVERGLL